MRAAIRSGSSAAAAACRSVLPGAGRSTAGDRRRRPSAPGGCARRPGAGTAGRHLRAPTRVPVRRTNPGGAGFCIPWPSMRVRRCRRLMSIQSPSPVRPPRAPLAAARRGPGPERLCGTSGRKYQWTARLKARHGGGDDAHPGARPQRDRPPQPAEQHEQLRDWASSPSQVLGETVQRDGRRDPRLHQSTSTRQPRR
jgi:hypothetical protein